MHFLVICICEDANGKLENLSCEKYILHFPQAWRLVASAHSSSPIQEMLSKPGADPVLSFSSKMLLGAELTSTCNTMEVLSISLCCNGLGQNRLKHICYLVLFNFLWNCAYYFSQRSQILKRSRAPHTTYTVMAQVSLIGWVGSPTMIWALAAVSLSRVTLQGPQMSGGGL